MSTIDKATQGGKKLVLAGCVPQGQKALSGMEKYSILGVTHPSLMTVLTDLWLD